MRAGTISRGSRQWTLIAHLPIVVTHHRCTPPPVDHQTDIRVSCYISLYRSLLPRMFGMDTLPTATIPTSPQPGKSGPHQHQLLLFLVVTPPERRRTPIILPNERLPPVSVTPRGLRDLILQMLPIETADETIESGIVTAAAGIYKTILLLPLIRCLLPAATPLPIAVIVLVLVRLVTTAHPNHLQGTLISRSPTGHIPPHGPRISPLRPVLLLVSPSLSLTRLGGTIRGMTAGIQGN